MAEGFFHPAQLSIPNVSADQLCASMVRVMPRTLLVIDIVPDAGEARNRARNEAQADGSEHWYRYFTPEDLKKVDDPEFVMGMVRNEFSRLAKAGATFPATVPLEAPGTGFAISPTGHVLTNYHLVTAEVANYQREAGLNGRETLCRSLRAQTSRQRSDGSWEWQDAAAVWLVSNPPSARALLDVGGGYSELREDTALLRIDPPPQAWLELSDRIARPHEQVWMAGFPLRSARSRESLAAHGYSDADGSLRVSTGQVTEVDGEEYFTTDLDGSMGNSGSAILDASGAVIGLFSRAAGNGPRNALEFGHMSRVNVTSRLAIRGLELKDILRSARSR